MDEENLCAPVAWRLLAALVVSALAVGMGYALLTLPDEAKGLSEIVNKHMLQSGVENPVTAVLLNFRGYDTLLEMAVLFLALVGVWSFQSRPVPLEPHPGPVLMFLVELLVPLMVIVSGYLLWIGSKEPGGAFQSGAVLAASGVLFLLIGTRPHPRFQNWHLRTLVVLGVSMFIGVGAAVMTNGGQLLQYPPGMAGSLILLIEAASSVSIGVILAAVFHGGRPHPEESG